ncbi:MAG: 30S ribosomal protein S17 [Candidatus Caccosoma sp.]|nr:30S ribosomal protein S17 [Candidatus Caccosoma sp.]
MERNTRRVLNGIVVSNTNDKTITVEVSTSKKHPLYNKDFVVTKKYRAHDENNEAQVGDTVVIEETRPLSATKRFRLVKITKKSVANN